MRAKGRGFDEKCVCAEPRRFVGLVDSDGREKASQEKERAILLHAGREGDLDKGSIIM